MFDSTIHAIQEQNSRLKAQCEPPVGSVLPSAVVAEMKRLRALITPEPSLIDRFNARNQGPVQC